MKITPYTIFIIILIGAGTAFLTPSGGTMNYVTNYTSPSQEGTEIASARRHIHVMNIEATQQNLFWKGYVGNITGRFTLSDGSSSLFD